MKLHEEFKLFENMWDEPSTLTESKDSKSVWVWDVYEDAADKGSCTSIQNLAVFETKDKAIRDGEMFIKDAYGAADDYTIDTIEIPVDRVPEATLRSSGLDHLWDPTTAAYKKAGRCPKCSNEILYNLADLTAGFVCPYCSTKLSGRVELLLA
jgi:hypothetical protein